MSDICGHNWAYPPAVDSFPAIPGPHWPRLDAYKKSGGLINADILQPAAAIALGPAIAAGVADGECRPWSRNGRCRFGVTCIFKHVGSAQAGGNSTKRPAEAAAAVVPAAAPGVPAAAAVAAGAGRRPWGPLLAPQWPKRTNRGAGLVPWGLGRSEDVRK